MSKRTVLITGVKGMAGSHLADMLLDGTDFEVVGLDLPDRPWDDNIKNCVGLRYYDLDVRKRDDMHMIMSAYRPAWVFHLAAEAFVPDSWECPGEVLETNTIGTINVLEAVRRSCPSALVQIACTSEEYGMVYTDEVPINHKTQPLRPLSTYGVSKIAAEMAGSQYTRSYGVRTVLTRTFNHTGPRQNDQYVTSAFCKEALQVCLGQRDFVQHGNLDAVRDFTDVRDICRAYIAACEWMERTGVGSRLFQIGGGTVLSMRNLLEAVCKATGLEMGVQTKAVAERMRPSDVPLLVCDSSEFRSMTGWAPKISYEQTVQDVLAYWREKLGEEAANV